MTCTIVWVGRAVDSRHCKPMVCMQTSGVLGLCTGRVWYHGATDRYSADARAGWNHQGGHWHGDRPIRCRLQSGRYPCQSQGIPSPLQTSHSNPARQKNFTFTACKEAEWQ